MNLLLLVAVGGVLLILAGRTYPHWIGRVFHLDDDRPPPSEEFADGRDYVRSPTAVVFAHHFASIAGAGPIIGPIFALAYGWGWAWIWIVIGGIFYGAVQDMTAMCVSLREGGKTIAEIARRTLGNGGYFLFLSFLLIVISVVNAVFLTASAKSLSLELPLIDLGLDPSQTILRTRTTDDGATLGRIGGIATTSVIVMTLAAPFIGMLISKRHLRTMPIFLIAGVICIASVVAGFFLPVGLDPTTWMYVLGVYVFFASWIPVWLVLQPRDFMNVQLLYGGMILLVAGVFTAGLRGGGMQMDMSRVAAGTAAMGPVWPIMFITIACGAISGFHTLVATGTTIKQLPRETDCRRIGYNAMLLESFLALLVVAAVAGQMDTATYTHHLGASAGYIQVFAVGCGSLFGHLGIPTPIGCVIGVLILEGFLVTTLDTSVRLARYLLDELWNCVFHDRAPALLRSPVVNTLIAVGLMAVFASAGNIRSSLWPLFGAGNQLIGALALTTVSVWLLQRGRTAWFTLVPAAFMVATALWALVYKVRTAAARTERAWTDDLLIAAGGCLILLAAGFLLVALARMYAALRTAHRDPSDDRV